MSTRRERQAAAARRRRQLRWGAVLVGVVAILALGGLLFLPIDDDGGDAPGGPNGPTVPISMVEYAFDPVDATAAPGQTLAISNDGAIAHSYFIVDLAKGLELAGGDEGTLALPDDVTPGEYRVICDLPGHVELGMVGTITIE